MAWEPDYITDTELKNYVRIEDTDDDTQVAWAISTASRAVDTACGRQFGKLDSVAARYYTPYWDAELRRNVVDIDDLYSTTGLLIAVDGSGDETFSSSLTDYTLRPRNAVQDGVPWTMLTANPSSSVGLPTTPDSVRVTGAFGWAAVPVAIKQATALQASRLLARRNSPFGVAGSPENGSELRLLAKLDPDVEVSLKKYKRRKRPRQMFA